MPDIDSIRVTMWDDETVELSNERARSEIPVLPTLTRHSQTVSGGGFECLAYLALQVQHSTDKEHTFRCIASASAMLLNTKENLTGAPNPSVPLVGLERAQKEDVGDSELLETNLEGATPVTIGELLNLMEADPDEIGAYFGVLFVAGNKRVTNANRTAFNERRRAAATASILGEPKIFVSDSPFLADAVLTRVYASFLSFSPMKAHLTKRIVSRLSNDMMGPGLAFASMFLLLTDFGLSALRIIKEAVVKHPWIRTDFPELEPELAAANQAQNIIRRIPGKERSFCKAIHGSNFVPLPYSLIDNLLGVCKTILQRTTPSYENYGGGRITDSQRDIINGKLGAVEHVSTGIRAD